MCLMVIIAVVSLEHNLCRRLGMNNIGRPTHDEGINIANTPK
jgi:hypothetical protein